MSYESALKAAGVEVIEFVHFGSYQGDWLALIRDNGVIGVAEGCYGSCSYCDAFESEFGYDDEGEDYQERLADFGRGYLPAYTLEEKIERIEPLAKEYDWGDYQEMLDQLLSWKSQYGDNNV